MGRRLDTVDDLMLVFYDILLLIVHNVTIFHNALVVKEYHTVQLGIIQQAPSITSSWLSLRPNGT